jgi:glycosyltransferase involved in cell wall biosynthesis
MKKILLISHDASRTGAPILLLNLTKWLVVKKPTLSVSVLLVKGGELELEFKKVTKTYILNVNNEFNNNLSKNIDKLFQRLRILYFGWDLIFSNTIVNGEVLKYFVNKKIKIVSYIHELKQSIDIYSSKNMVEGTLKRSHYFFCGSNMVRDSLIYDFHVSSNITSVVNSFIDFNNHNYFKIPSKNKALRKKFKIKSSTTVVGMIGASSYRKGFDIFLDTARKMKNKDIHFIWVGADEKSSSQNNFDGLKLSLIAPCEGYLEYYHLFDVFFLSSREDPYPMVLVEASAFGIPIICFKNSGGAQEFVDEKVGVIIPFLNSNAAKSYIHKVINNQFFKTENFSYIKEKSKKNMTLILMQNKCSLKYMKFLSGNRKWSHSETISTF